MYKYTTVILMPLITKKQEWGTVQVFLNLHDLETENKESIKKLMLLVPDQLPILASISTSQS